MQIKNLIQNKEKLDDFYNNYLKRKLLLKSVDSSNLKNAHLKKAEHNLEFIQNINNKEKFNDWVIVSLYYSLYHSFLALIENKGYSSKNHNATIVFILKNYLNILDDDLSLLDNLKVSEEDAIFYTNLKEKRNQASYSTNINIKLVNIDELILNVKEINLKIENIIQNS